MNPRIKLTNFDIGYILQYSDKIVNSANKFFKIAASYAILGFRDIVFT